ncbi:hypothetical protein E4U53_006531, partial [Claviceps sorghi]
MTSTSTNTSANANKPIKPTNACPRRPTGDKEADHAHHDHNGKEPGRPTRERGPAVQTLFRLSSRVHRRVRRPSRRWCSERHRCACPSSSDESREAGGYTVDWRRVSARSERGVASSWPVDCGRERFRAGWHEVRTGEDE